MNPLFRMHKHLERTLRVIIWIGLGVVFLLPLYVDSSFFFPYIVPKMLFFKVAVEIMVMAWLALLLARKQYEIPGGIVVLIFAAYLLVMFVSSYVGGNFAFSFWSTVERSEGLLLWVHLLAFVIVMIGTMRTKKDWHIVMDLFFIGAQLVAITGLLQYLGVSMINVSSGGARIASSIGNAAFLAGYMLFSFFIGLYLSTVRKNKYMKVVYILFCGLNLFIILQSGTRGAYIAMLTVAVIFFFINIGRLSVKKLRHGMIVAAMVILLVLGLAFMQRDSNWVSNNHALNRLTSISLNDRTTMNRLMVWEEAYKGFLEKPVLGYGQEQFYVVSSKYFNPGLYEDAGSQIWFDRAHNIYLDHLITGGVVGLGLYIAVLLLVIWPLLKDVLRRNNTDITEQERLGQQMLLYAVVAFMIQGMFVFETLVVYLGLIVIVGYVSWQYYRRFVSLSRNATIMVFIIASVVLIPMMYYFNVRETKANLTSVAGMQLQHTNPKLALDSLLTAIDYDSAGTNEYRRRLTESFATVLANQSLPPDDIAQYADRVDRELELYLEDKPFDAAFYLLVMRHYNHTHILDQARLDKALAIGAQAIEISPTQTQFYYEIGYSYYYKALRARENGDEVAARSYIGNSVQNFDKAIEISPIKESYVNALIILLSFGESDQISSYLERMGIDGIEFRSIETLERLANSAVNGKVFSYAINFFEMILELEPNDPKNYINLALAYAGNNQPEEAISIAEEIKKFGGLYTEQSEAFIADVKSGIVPN